MTSVSVNVTEGTAVNFSMKTNTFLPGDQMNMCLPGEEETEEIEEDAVTAPVPIIEEARTDATTSPKGSAIVVHHASFYIQKRVLIFRLASVTEEMIADSFTPKLTTPHPNVGAPARFKRQRIQDMAQTVVDLREDAAKSPRIGILSPFVVAILLLQCVLNVGVLQVTTYALILPLESATESNASLVTPRRAMITRSVNARVEKGANFCTLVPTTEKRSAKHHHLGHAMITRREDALEVIHASFPMMSQKIKVMNKILWKVMMELLPLITLTLSPRVRPATTSPLASAIVGANADLFMTPRGSTCPRPSVRLRIK